MSPEWNWLTGASGSSGNDNQIRTQVYDRARSPRGWALSAGYNSDNTQKAIVPAEYEPIREPSVSESLFKIVIAKQLTAVPPGKEMSRIDRSQQKLVNGLNWALKKVGQEGNVTIPSGSNINSALNGVARTYIDILPEGVSSLTEIDREVDAQTRGMIWRLEAGRLDKDYSTTEDERMTAMQIREKIGQAPPEELRKIFVESVYGRASDIVRAQNGNRLAYHQQELSRGLSRIRRFEPKQWFAVDLLTNLLMLTPEERKQMQNIIWTVTPGSIHVRDINRVGEDFRRYPLSDLARGSEGIIVLPGTVDYVDRVRRLGGPLFQPAINRWATTNIGGLILLRTLGREEPAAKFLVREPVATANGLRQTASIAREVENLHGMMTEAIRNPEAAMRFPVRPNKIRELLPDPIVLELGVLSHPDGTINYGPAIKTLEQRKEDLQIHLRTLAIRAAVELDEKGNPPIDIQRAMTSLEKAVERTESTQRRLEAKNATRQEDQSAE